MPVLRRCSGRPSTAAGCSRRRTRAARITRRYRPNTLILETRFETEAGAATLIDFMPPRGQHANVIRIVKGERGKLTFQQ